MSHPTVPCEPHNVTVISDCSSDGGLIRWEEAEHGDFFYVLATGLDGHQTTCGSDPFAECWLTGLHCGQRYNLTITVQDHVCNSSHTYRTLRSGGWVSFSWTKCYGSPDWQLQIFQKHFEF